MRLLKRGPQGEITLTTDLVDDVPPYFILSHTWAINNEDEVTFDDLQTNRGADKPGWEKIRFCAEQAKKDGHPQYFWVDTCCINKSNYTELSEAITSMFRWYRNAVKCYVYLPDVSAFGPHPVHAQYQWEAYFRDSRWFKRGWTLQELLAPSVVEFYSRNGNYLGDKRTLEGLIHDITQIPIAALRGGSLSLFPIDERLRWTTGRITKRPEDQAYCLLGIFDLFMPLIYGEGQNAMKRLKEEIDKRSQTPSSAPERSYLVDFRRIERKLDDIVGQLQKGGRNDFGAADPDSEDDPVSQQQWGALRKELTEGGFPKDLIDDLKPWIGMKIRPKVQDQETKSPDGVATDGATSKASSRPTFEPGLAKADVFRDLAPSQYPPLGRDAQFQGCAVAPAHSNYQAPTFADPWASPPSNAAFQFSNQQTPYTPRPDHELRRTSGISTFLDPSPHLYTAPIAAESRDNSADPTLASSTAGPALGSAYSGSGAAERLYPRDDYLRHPSFEEYFQQKLREIFGDLHPPGVPTLSQQPSMQEPFRRTFIEPPPSESITEPAYSNGSGKLRRSPSISSMTSVHSDVSEHDSQGNITKRTVTTTTTTYYSADDSASDIIHAYPSSYSKMSPRPNQSTDRQPSDSPPIVTSMSFKAPRPTRDKYKCKICQECFTKQTAFLLHKFAKHTEKPFTCPVMTCTKKFSNLESLRQHGRLHRKNDHVMRPSP